MRNELTNLLPSERQRTLYRNYLFRICVVVLVVVTILTFFAAILLIPTYVFLSASANIKNERLASMKSDIESKDDTELAARLSRLLSDTESLKTLSDIKSMSGTVRDVLTISRPGITLSSITLSPSVGAESRTMILSGLSATRSALRNYEIALQNAPSVLSANVPISAYAKDADITFTVTITFRP